MTQRLATAICIRAIRAPFEGLMFTITSFDRALAVDQNISLESPAFSTS
jgi:hypothetical protein